MSLIALQNVTKIFQGEKLFEPVSFRIEQKERVALIGPNGTGKSTILKMIVNEEEPSEGQIVISKQYKIGYLSQEILEDLSHTLFGEIDSVFAPLHELEKRLESLNKKMLENPSDQSLVAQYSELQDEFNRQDGYNYTYKIDMMLFKFGFRKEDYSRPLSSFSGGERMKIAFVKLLLIKPDLLILDEPTNHLDIDTIEWLEDYLKSYEGSLLFVSHDRYFINALATRILELDQKHIEEYKGNYDYYAAQKKLRYEQRLELYKKQQEEAKKLQWFITFYMPKPRFASRAHDREKKLARLESNMIDKPTVTRSKMKVEFDGTSRRGRREIEIKDLTIGYENKPLISGINLTLFGGDKLAVMGANGSGKTTFLKVLMHQVLPLSGSFRFLENLSIGYLKQDTMALSSPDTIYGYIKRRYPQMTEQEIYDHLGKYAFSYEDDQKVIDTLSGGERMRVVLAEMALHHYGLLILDEPTNHLDMMSKEEFIEALNHYQGTLLVVTHDRYFADSVCSRLLYFEDGKAYVYEGRYSDFKVEVLDALEEKREEILKENHRQEEEREKAEKPAYVPVHEKKPRPRLSEDKIYERLEKLDQLIPELEEKYNDPYYYQDSSRLDALEEEVSKNKAEYASLMDMLEQYDELRNQKK
jgi:ATP-binding cassette subfamily F protein 3